MVGSSAILYISRWRIHSSERTTNDGICYNWSLPQTLIGIPFPCNLSRQNLFTSNLFWKIFWRAFCKPISSIALEVWVWLWQRSAVSHQQLWQCEVRFPHLMAGHTGKGMEAGLNPPRSAEQLKTSHSYPLPSTMHHHFHKYFCTSTCLRFMN